MPNKVFDPLYEENSSKKGSQLREN